MRVGSNFSLGYLGLLTRARSVSLVCTNLRLALQVGIELLQSCMVNYEQPTTHSRGRGNAVQRCAVICRLVVHR